MTVVCIYKGRMANKLAKYKHNYARENSGNFVCRATVKGNFAERHEFVGVNCKLFTIGQFRDSVLPDRTSRVPR